MVYPMTHNITVEYNPVKCIGAQKCIEISPQHFSFDGEKAVLLGAGPHDGVQIVHIRSDPVQLKKIVKAGESCPVNAIKVRDNDQNKVLVSTEITLKPDVHVLTAEYDDRQEFTMDQQGYFLIRVDQQQQVIEVGLCRELNQVAVKIVGRKPLEIYQTIIKNNLLSRLDHAAYLGRELQKAYIALQKGIPYVQDDELVLSSGAGSAE